jgi:hypothetical protein
MHSLPYFHHSRQSRPGVLPGELNFFFQGCCALRPAEPGQLTVLIVISYLLAYIKIFEQKIVN